MSDEYADIFADEVVRIAPRWGIFPGVLGFRVAETYPDGSFHVALAEVHSASEALSVVKGLRQAEVLEHVD